MTRSARETLEDALYHFGYEGADESSSHILAYLSEQGFVVVPREPTEKMIQAAWDEAWDDENGYPGDGWAGPRTTYTAMLAAINGNKKEPSAEAEGEVLDR